MSTAPKELGGVNGENNNVVSMQDALKEALALMTQTDEMLHKGIRRLRGRIYAFELAEDPEFAEEYRKGYDQLFATEG